MASVQQFAMDTATSCGARESARGPVAALDCRQQRPTARPATGPVRGAVRGDVGQVKVGIPREVKDHEYRVAITPAGVNELTSHGHEVVVEKDAGTGSSIPDDDYVAAGATILPTADDVWGEADLVLKVK